MIRWSAAAFALLSLAACGEKEEAPDASGKDTSAIANIELVTSPGGVTAWLVSESFVPIIAMEVSWRGGATAEAPGKDGAGWVLGYMMNEGAEIIANTPAQFAAYIKSETEKWGRVIKAAGIKPQ
jgi:hypothetical protein